MDPLFPNEFRRGCRQSTVLRQGDSFRSTGKAYRSHVLERQLRIEANERGARVPRRVRRAHGGRRRAADAGKAVGASLEMQSRNEFMRFGAGIREKETAGCVAE